MLSRLATFLLTAFVFLQTSDASCSKCFGTLCSSHESNVIRGTDCLGRGHYNAPRGERLHKGVDILCRPESDVRAPFSANVVRISKPYSDNDGRHNNGLLLQGTGQWSSYSVKMWYFTPSVSPGSSVSKGQKIGTSERWPSDCISQHIHLEMEDQSDPTKFVC